jgi:hypothetical protein
MIASVLSISVSILSRSTVNSMGAKHKAISKQSTRGLLALDFTRNLQTALTKIVEDKKLCNDPVATLKAHLPFDLLQDDSQKYYSFHFSYKDYPEKHHIGLIKLSDGKKSLAQRQAKSRCLDEQTVFDSGFAERKDFYFCVGLTYKGREPGLIKLSKHFFEINVQFIDTFSGETLTCQQFAAIEASSTRGGNVFINSIQGRSTEKSQFRFGSARLSP